MNAGKEYLESQLKEQFSGSGSGHGSGNQGMCRIAFVSPSPLPSSDTNLLIEQPSFYSVMVTLKLTNIFTLQEANSLPETVSSLPRSS